MGILTNYVNSSGTDIGAGLVEKSYLIDQYPNLANTFRFAGLWTWGNNYNSGQLGDNTILRRSSPVQTVAGGTNWKSVACLGYGCAAIKTDGTLWNWGNNTHGQLGDNGGASQTSSPVQTVSGGTNWKLVAGGGYHTAAIKTDGSLWLWGRGDAGQLGDNSSTSKSSPVQTVSAGNNWKSVSCATLFTAAIKTDGTLWTWGYNAHGELGDNSLTNRSSPVQTVAGGTNWKSVSSGHYSTAAIKTDGTLWTWGYNSNGQLGDNSLTNRSSPVQTVAGGTWKSSSVGVYSAAAIKTDGTLWLWGYNNYGQLGNNSVVQTSSPVQTVAGGTNWKSVAGGQHIAAIKTDGTLWTWGRNDFYQLGDNTQTSFRSSPVQTVAGGNNWKSVDCGTYHTAAIRDNSDDYI